MYNLRYWVSVYRVWNVLYFTYIIIDTCCNVLINNIRLGVKLKVLLGPHFEERKLDRGVILTCVIEVDDIFSRKNFRCNLVILKNRLLVIQEKVFILDHGELQMSLRRKTFSQFKSHFFHSHLVPTYFSQD